MAGSVEDQNTALQGLFANLRSSSSRAQNSPWMEGASSQPQPPYLLNFGPSRSRTASESVQPPAQSATMPASSSLRMDKGQTPNPADQSGQDRTASLLNLLKFNSAGNPSNAGSPIQQPALGSRVSYASPQLGHNSATRTLQGRGVSASDLVGASMGRPASRASASPSPTAETSNLNITNPQDYLLQLLSRSQPAHATAASATASKSQSTAPATTPGNASSTLEATESIPRESDVSKLTDNDRRSSMRNESPIRVFGSRASKEPTPFEPQDIPKVEAQSQPIFTYVNPFDQLAASSPRNIKPTSNVTTPLKEKQYDIVNGGKHLRRSKDTSPEPGHTSTRRKLASDGHEVLQSIEMPSPQLLDDGRSRVEALIGIGAPTNNAETVAQALADVGKLLDRQVAYALGEAQDRVEKAVHKQEVADKVATDNFQDTAAMIKQEVRSEDGKGALKVLAPEPTASAGQGVVNETAAGTAEGHHGSADDENSSVKAEDDFEVPVYNFPMRPFVSIDLTQDNLPDLHLRQGTITDIARLKKDFDQIDRTLATASQDYIVYAMPKPGGVRLIRQDDGFDRQIFKETRDHVFNVAISTAPAGKGNRGFEAFIATAISGSVYWTGLRHAGEDIIRVENIGKHCLVFPPTPVHDENTSGGQLKTRAKKSNRHPEFFAIGRGKSIHIVFPNHARNSKFVKENSIVDTDGYFRDRSLKINTGKAGKDFAFSEDDTVVATLDKAGRLRFWDVRELVNEQNGIASKIAPVEVSIPVGTFATALPGEKPWPTSVLFADKLRPYSKGTAQRYVIVGMKQNHTLQLWDLGLGKAVQELNFPHQNESDAICSVVYHPASGIIVVGHPTRNSIYFIHLSAPKYNLTGRSQINFITQVVQKDSSLPKPESTAIMSGMREYSFASKGQLRSLDLLSTPSASSESKDDQSLFELYVMHSKGVTCLNIKKADLGWSAESKVLSPVNAEKAGLIVVKELRDVHPDSELLTPMDEEVGAITSNKVSKKPATTATRGHATIVQDAPVAAETKPPIELTTDGTAGGGGGKPEKRKKKKGVAGAEDATSSIPPSAPDAPLSYASAAQRGLPLTSEKDSARQLPAKALPGDIAEPSSISTLEPSNNGGLPASEPASLDLSAELLGREFKKMEQNVSSEFSRVLGRELEALYRRFDEDRRVQDAAGAARQDAVLRLVSATLTENVDKTLNHIIASNIQQHVVPAVNNITASTLNKGVPDWLDKQVLTTLPPQLKTSLAGAVSNAVQQADFLRLLSDQVTSKISKKIDKEFSSTLNQTIVPAFRNLAVTAATSLAAETERRVSEQLERANLQHRNDNTKIEQLTALVRELSEMVRTMAVEQSGFQSVILRLQEQGMQQNKVPSNSPSENQAIPAEPIATAPSPEDLELETVAAMMNEGLFEEGTIQWLQSSNQTYLFDAFFVKVNPDYLQECAGLITLSVGAAVTQSLDNNVAERLHWLNTVLSLVDPRDPDLHQVAPKIMEVLVQRLESRYMHISELEPGSPLLRQIPPLTRKARELGSLGRS